MRTPNSVVDMFYGLSEVADTIDDENVNRWLGALVLLLAEEHGDSERVITLARDAAQSMNTTGSDSENIRGQEEEPS